MTDEEYVVSIIPTAKPNWYRWPLCRIVDNFGNVLGMVRCNGQMSYEECIDAAFKNAAERMRNEYDSTRVG